MKVDEGGSAADGFVVTMHYKKTDPFGEVSVNTTRCIVKMDAGTGKPYLAKVDINGSFRKYPQESEENIKRFNAGIDAILASPPDLTLPYVPSEEIGDYKDLP